MIRKVLIVDDDSEVRSLVRRMLVDLDADLQVEEAALTGDPEYAMQAIAGSSSTAPRPHIRPSWTSPPRP